MIHQKILVIFYIILSCVAGMIFGKNILGENSYGRGVNDMTISECKEVISKIAGDVSDNLQDYMNIVHSPHIPLEGGVKLN